MYNQIELQKKNCEAAKNEAIQEKMVAKNAVSALTREIEWLQRQTVAELGNIDGLIRDRDKMLKDIELVETENQNNKQKIMGLETEKAGIKV
jgi:seryl-tRNA synthetase